MEGPFFYYVQIEQTEEIKPRLSSEWPPIGREPNPVIVGPIKITEEEAQLHLDELMLKYPHQNQ